MRSGSVGQVLPPFRRAAVRPAGFELHLHATCGWFVPGRAYQGRAVRLDARGRLDAPTRASGPLGRGGRLDVPTRASGSLVRAWAF
jgi:hypothetical protein